MRRRVKYGRRYGVNTTFGLMNNIGHSNQIELERIRYFLECPGLFEASLPDGTPLFQTDIEALDDVADPELGDTKLRFGQAMERYFAAWLAGHPRYDVLAQNLQLISDGVTLGELDFIVHDRALADVLHIELAYKFYILESGHWIGPNRRDNLDAKLYKLKHQQFPLLYHALCQKALRVLGIDVAAIRQLACLKGQLFLPKGHTGPLPGGVNPEAVCGQWMSVKDFEAMPHSGMLLCQPPKIDWLLPPFKGRDWMEHSEAVAAMKPMELSQLYWVKSENDSFERLMVVPA